MSVNIDLKEKTALITGATRGIGRAIATDFLTAGANLILTGTNLEKKQALHLKSRKEENHRIHWVQADFSDLQGIQKFVGKLQKFNNIDICVNNAGINQINLVEETTVEDYQKIMTINLTAPFMICRQLAAQMKKMGYGRIVNIASIWSVKTKVQRSLYTITKAGLVGFTKTLAVELASSNVLVNAVSPGFTMTELTKSILSSDEINILAKQVPTKRFAEPHEIAKVVLFLVSGLNTYITGQNIIVDGGFVNV